MSVIKDFKQQNLHLRKRYWLRESLNANNWKRVIIARKQRAERGWADRDVWNGGDHILRVTSGILKELGGEKSHVDWDDYFKTNYQTRGYNNLLEVANDIDNYLAFQDHSWIDDLDFELKTSSKKLGDGSYEMISLNNPDEQRRIQVVLRNHHDQHNEHYRKMKNAMIFVSINAPHLWD